MTFKQGAVRMREYLQTIAALLPWTCMICISQCAGALAYKSHLQLLREPYPNLAHYSPSASFSGCFQVLC
jgi:hypothetical protein